MQADKSKLKKKISIRLTLDGKISISYKFNGVELHICVSLGQLVIVD